MMNSNYGTNRFAESFAVGPATDLRSAGEV
jgi:hypothetical protein